MKNTEKTFLFAVVIIGIGLAFAGYWFILREQPQIQEDDPSAYRMPEPVETTEPEEPEAVEEEYQAPEEEEVPSAEEEGIALFIGRVVDEKKKPIPGAVVAVYRARSNVAFLINQIEEKKTKPLTQLKSDEKGDFQTEPLYAGVGYRLVADHEDYCRKVIDDLSLKEGEDTHLPPIVLSVAKTVHGRVRDDKGRPISGATIAVLNSIVNPNKPVKPLRMVKTDDDGKYTVLCLESADFLIRASAKGHESKTERNKLTFDKKSEFEFNFTLAKEMTIKGQVLDDQGKPLAGASIQAIQLKTKERPTLWFNTDKEGKFTLRGLSQSSYYIAAAHKEFSPASHNNVAAGRDDVVFILQPRSGITGQVVDAQNRPVKSYWIIANRTSPAKESGVTRYEKRKFSHPDGRFTFDCLDPGKYVLEVQAKGYATYNSKPVKVVAESFSGDLLVQLNKGGSVSGIVLDHEGNPLKRVYVHIRSNNYRPNPIENIFGVTEKHQKSSIRTDANGRFEITNVVPGTYQLEFDHRRYPPLRVNDIVVEMNYTTEAPVQRMKLGATLKGTVFNDANAVVPSAKVTINKTDHTFHRIITTDQNGSYKISDLPPGEYIIAPQPPLGDKNPFSMIGSAIRSQVQEPVKLHEGEVKDLTLIIYS